MVHYRNFYHQGYKLHQIATLMEGEFHLVYIKLHSHKLFYLFDFFSIFKFCACSSNANSFSQTPPFRYLIFEVEPLDTSDVAHEFFPQCENPLFLIIPNSTRASIVPYKWLFYACLFPRRQEFDVVPSGLISMTETAR